MRQFVVPNFDAGLVTKIEDQSIPEQAASNSLNWLTLSDRIELSGGYTIVGTEAVGAGKITGLEGSIDANGDPQTFRTLGQKIEYYDAVAVDWAETGTNELGADADGEDIVMTPYTSLAGYQMWASSPNSSLFKIMISNPASITDVYDAAKNFKGYLNAQNNRLHMWNRRARKNYLYGSYKDLQDTSVYTSVAGEVIGTGNGVLVTFANTLVFKAAGAKRTCFNIVVTDTVETFIDDLDGTLTGDAGGTGTINYTTGAISVTFAVAPLNLQNITADYQWEDSTAQGLADFTFSATRVASEGYFLPQSTGGDLLNVLPYQTDFYCLHEKNAWLFSMPISDTNPTNQIFRDSIGASNHAAAVATGDGIYYIDTSNPSNPEFKLLQLQRANDKVEPTLISFNLDLGGFVFDDGHAEEWDNYVVFTGRTEVSEVTNRMFLFHRIFKTFDIVEYYTSALTPRGSALWAGDVSQNNVMQLFTSFSANGTVMNNVWEGKLTRLGVDEIKKFKRLTIQGSIGPSQVIEVYLSFDRGAFALIGTIDGDGTYVDSGVSVEVGSPQVGAAEVGGGGDGINAFNYVKEFRVRTQRFDQVKIRFIATDVGYASVSTIDYFDVKTYGQKNIQRYRQTL